MGGLNYQKNLLNALLENQSARITPVLFLGEDVELSALQVYNQISGLKIVRSSIFNRENKLSRLMKSLLLGIDYQAIDIFKEHNIDVVFESATFYGWRFPLKMLAWIPDLQHLRLKQYFGFFAFCKREIGFRMQLLGNRFILLSSEDAKKDFQLFYKVSPQKLFVARFAVPVQLHEFDADSVIARYDLPAHFFYLPNQFWRHKNHECVIRALASAKQSGQSLTVAVTGNTNDPRDPNYYPDLMKLAKTLDIEENFRVLGLIPYHDVQALMLSCVALINPSRFEGWSTTVEEAKALNIAMILSDINVHREQAGVNALFFNVDDPECLANILIDCVNQHHLNVRDSQKDDVAGKSQKNMAHFAECFTDIIYKVAEST